MPTPVKHRDCVLNVDCWIADPESRWTPIVGVSWSPGGGVDVELFTESSFATREEAEQAGMDMGIRWIDSWHDL